MQPAPTVAYRVGGGECWIRLGISHRESIFHRAEKRGAEYPCQWPSDRNRLNDVRCETVDNENQVSRQREQRQRSATPAAVVISGLVDSPEEGLAREHAALCGGG